MSYLQTSEVYSRSRTFTNKIANDTMLFDEKNMVKLDQKQQNREAYVRSKLNGLNSHEFNEYNEYEPPTYAEVTTGSSKLNLDIKSRIELLRKKIQDIQAEKKKVLEDGVIQVRSYMEQLKREQAAHAKEMQKLRDDDTQVSANFIKEVEKLKSQYKQQKKPLDEILSQVKTTIVETGVAPEDSISSIQVTEVKTSDSDEQ